MWWWGYGGFGLIFDLVLYRRKLDFPSLPVVNNSTERAVNSEGAPSLASIILYLLPFVAVLFRASVRCLFVGIGEMERNGLTEVWDCVILNEIQF